MKRDVELVHLANSKLRESNLDSTSKELIRDRLARYDAAIELAFDASPPDGINRTERWCEQQQKRANYWKLEAEKRRRELERVVVSKSAKVLKGGLES